MRNIPKPQAGEYPPYAIMYIDLVPDDGQVLQHMQDNLATMRQMFESLPEEKLTERFAEGEWTIKEILVHITDDERIYSYRALRFARGDSTELPGFEPDPYAEQSRANERSITDILDEHHAVRLATIALFNTFTDDMLTRTGVASEHRVSVRALAHHIAGHELHHLNSIRENYLSS